MRLVRPEPAYRLRCAMSGRRWWETETSAYALGRDRLETERLRGQADALAPMAAALLDRVELTEGGAGVDVGCGPAGILELLSERVGPRGRVVGVDNDPAHVAAARAYAAERALGNVEIVEAAADRTGLPASSFDLVHTRALLVNIPEPAAVVVEMVRLARPGGYVLVQEPDTSLRICHPPDPSWDRLVELYEAAFQRDGADLRVGRRLPGFLRDAGLVELGAEVHGGVFPAGHPRRPHLPDLARTLRATIVARGDIDEAGYDELDRAVRTHLADPGVFVLTHLFFIAWGQKPPAEAP